MYIYNLMKKIGTILYYIITFPLVLVGLFFLLIMFGLEMDTYESIRSLDNDPESPLPELDWH